MGSVKVEKMGGMMPSWDERFLPDDQASFARNTYLYSGAAIGWRTPKLLRALTNSAAKFAYRVPTITQGVAGANLVLTANPTAGDTVTLGEITYTLVTAPAQPYDVLLGSNSTTTARALFQAMTFGSIDPTIVGTNTPVNPAIASDSPYLGNAFQFAAGTNAPGANTIALVRVVPTGTMNLTDLNTLPQTTNDSAKMTGVVYDSVSQINAAGTAYVDIPTSLLGTGAEVFGVTAGQLLTSHLAIPVTLQEGHVYFVGFTMDSTISLQLASAGTTAVSNPNTYTNGPPNPFQTTTLSGVTTGGTTVGSVQTQYNLNQPNWLIYASMAAIGPKDPVNTIGTVQIGGSGPALDYLALLAPEFGTAFNQTPVAVNSASMVWLKDTNSLVDTTAFFTGGQNQSVDGTITGASQWLEFLDQDTNVLKSPVVDDVFQRFYFASPSLPPQYNTYDRITAGLPAFYLGVPAPPIAPTLVVTNGGNPTQIGFPGSSVATTFSPTDITPFNRLIFYPMTTSIEATLTDVSVQLSSVGPSGSVSVFAAVFYDSATTPGVPGGIFNFGNTVTVNTSTAPGPIVSSFAASPTLLAGTQYWIGVVFSLADAGSTGFQFALSNSGTAGSTGTYTTVPVDPKTGLGTAPPTTTGAPNLQLWGDLVVTGTNTAQEETRAYVYTWVTAYNEEGPPSPPALLDAFDNATWVVGLQPPLVQDTGTLRNIVKVNIYRTMASVQGGTVFFFVGSVGAAATTFIDQVTDDVVATNAILPSTTWFGPPTTLQGLVPMPNGMMAGFKGNEVWFCEPFRPHAWPAGYVMTTDFPIVGLGVSGTTLVAATNTNPQAFTGVSPSTMSQTRIPLAEPCISRGGVLSTEDSVYYPSQNGLIKVSKGGTASNLTQSWITREKWDKYTPSKFIRAVKNVSTYFAFGSTGVTNGNPDTSVAQQGFTIELSEADQASFSVWPQVGGHRIGFSTLTSPGVGNIDNVLVDPWSSVAMLLGGGNLYYYDFSDPGPNITPYLWRSKKFQGPHRDNFAAFRVWFDIPPGGPQVPPGTRTEIPFTLNPPTAAIMAYTPGMFGVVRIIADGFYITERELRYTTELMRVSSQSRYTTWQIEIEGVVSVSNIKMATTVKELGLMK